MIHLFQEDHFYQEGLVDQVVQDIEETDRTSLLQLAHNTDGLHLWQVPQQFLLFPEHTQLDPLQEHHILATPVEHDEDDVDDDHGGAADQIS